MQRLVQQTTNFFQTTVGQDFGPGKVEPKTNEKPRLKNLPKELLESWDFVDEGLYQVLLIPFKFEKLIFIQGLIQVSAIIYNIVVLPIRVTWNLLGMLLGKADEFNLRRQTDLIRVAIGVISTYFLLEVTNPSVVYHWIRAQADFKIYFLKSVCEIVHTMLTLVAGSILNNFSREFQLANANQQSEEKKSWRQSLRPGKRLKATLALLLYVVMHSWVLTMEMLITHVVLTQNYSSWFQFCIMNSVIELKISVFKKCDLAGLFTYVNNDAMDRFHVEIYIAATLLQTSQDRATLVYQAAAMYALKMVVDYIKHFFLTHMNKISIQFYSAMRNDIFRKLHLLSQQDSSENCPESTFHSFKAENDIDAAQAKTKWALLTTEVFDAESILCASRNFLVLPQACVILRTVVFIFRQRRYPIQNLPKTLFKLAILLLVVRFAIKAIIQIQIRRKTVRAAN